MHILRYRRADSERPRVGVLTDGRVTELEGTGSLGELWSLPLDELRDRLGNASGPESDPAEISLLAPVDGRTEVWACGVTYEISRAARREESERSADVYAQVYDAERPELFFKSAAWRVSGSGQPIAIRDDSAVNVPEPEVALVVTSAGQIAGYTVCNDVSSRSIEGENPLYLPQAKSYLGACAVGPMIRPAWEIADPYALTIRLAIDRGPVEIWQGTASTAQLRRRYDDLVRYLMHADIHPEGALLSTGTCLVPAAPFSLAEGDTVRIIVAGVGTLENPVVRGLAAMQAALDG
ncbi:MAG TPA: fumarylacetoacetate hydrolase family protein [Streptosporangiaceae bacterium]